MINFSYYLRGLNNLTRYIFREFPKGIDFSLRDLKTTYDGSNGYALTTKHALKNILKNINYEGKRFLDIGSGKGGAICYAYQLGASFCHGLEYERKLHLRAEKNIKRLNLQKKVKSINIDAREFKEYNQFDIYFIFNPFVDDVYADVLDCIISQNKFCNSEKYLIAYGRANDKVLSSNKSLKLISETFCPYKKYRILIYELLR